MITPEQTRDAIEIDRRDLLDVLKLRFGPVPETIRRAIEKVDDPDTLERLILVAANVPTRNLFVHELGEGTKAFRIVGETFNPIPAGEQGE
ncbi:hypothetical protein [Kyrpidia tusciae]|uniref:Uncharacterized protein n=1 Tax=Kyrpidia tusciae (strain DSM 2912 / NBRC 15312 / T2) TaxID=562970 RepID=D5WPV4_KYRT2|nr:hypothetical protein [Kyrpidia tusciae]ADG06363.1 hypothetical protein Btus_1656 [Kyrpidia tusciae DSM 2912]